MYRQEQQNTTISPHISCNCSPTTYSLDNFKHMEDTEGIHINKCATECIYDIFFLKGLHRKPCWCYFDVCVRCTTSYHTVCTVNIINTEGIFVHRHFFFTDWTQGHGWACYYKPSVLQQLNSVGRFPAIFMATKPSWPVDHFLLPATLGQTMMFS